METALAQTIHALVSEGAKVILVARRNERIDALANGLGDAALAVAADVGGASQVVALFAMVKERFGGLDLLFNNAGMGVYGLFKDSDPEDWRTQINSNIFGVLNCTHAAIPLMKDRVGAMICSVSSVGGRYGVPTWSVYCATKFAVVGFRDALRKELGGEESIRASVIEPGAVWTEFGHKVDEGMVRQRRESLDALIADDVALAVVYAFAQHPRALVEEILVHPFKQIAP
jgi:NADP-dependent 3-hydroxy acid dehydrogenase YdfG